MRNRWRVFTKRHGYGLGVTFYPMRYRMSWMVVLQLFIYEVTISRRP